MRRSRAMFGLCGFLIIGTCGLLAGSCLRPSPGVARMLAFPEPNLSFSVNERTPDAYRKAGNGS